MEPRVGSGDGDAGGEPTRVRDRRRDSISTRLCRERRGCRNDRPRRDDLGVVAEGDIANPAAIADAGAAAGSRDCRPNVEIDVAAVDTGANDDEGDRPVSLPVERLGDARCRRTEIADLDRQLSVGVAAVAQSIAVDAHPAADKAPNAAKSDGGGVRQDQFWVHRQAAISAAADCITPARTP
jgi:hypothetical protein